MERTELIMDSYAKSLCEDSNTCDICNGDFVIGDIYFDSDVKEWIQDGERDCSCVIESKMDLKVEQAIEDSRN